MPRPRRKKSKMYFGTPAQDAIIAYNKCKNHKERNKIYNAGNHEDISKDHIIIDNHIPT